MTVLQRNEAGEVDLNRTRKYVGAVLAIALVGVGAAYGIDQLRDNDSASTIHETLAAHPARTQSVRSLDDVAAIRFVLEGWAQPGLSLEEVAAIRFGSEGWAKTSSSTVSGQR